MISANFMARVKLNVYFCVVDDVTTPVLDSLRDARLPVKIWVPADDNGYRVQWRTHDIACITCDMTSRYPGCFRWDIGTPLTTLETTGINHMLARIVGHKSAFVCVDNRAHPCGQLVLFHDCHYKAEYPECFYKVKAFDTFDSLREFIDNIPDEFSLSDESRFVKTHYVMQGQSVYMETATRRYWYLDNLHKDHYEVFDYNGTHLGEADADGSVDFSRGDSKKKLDFKNMGRWR